MKILMLAPQPFYEERGTPIAVDLVLRTLSQRGEQVDLLTYHLGKPVEYKGIQVHRIRNLKFIREVPPGFSNRKVVCDLFLLFKALSMAFRKRYELVHAVEEAVFIAMLLKVLFRIPYIYDMDSSLAQQMVERYPRLFKPVYFLLSFFEGIAIRHAKAVVPVCDALSANIQKYHPERVVILRDVSLLERTNRQPKENLRTLLGIQGTLMMYIGNLESYQGIDLLLESFALTLKRASQASLVIIGGKEADIRKYQEMARQLGIHDRVYFLGPKPVTWLADYLAQADILVSPRVKGVNTPMKVYSYLDSGKALLATNLPTHTQVLNDQVAMLARPTPLHFSNGVLRLVEDRKLRAKLGQAGQALIAERHSISVFQETLNTLYDWLRPEIAQDKAKGTVPRSAPVTGTPVPGVDPSHKPASPLGTGSVVGRDRRK